MTGKKKNPFEVITQIDSFRLANFMIAISWKAMAATTALAVRLLTSTILAIARRRQHDRETW